MMPADAGAGIAGSQWRKTLRHVTYDAVGNVKCASEYRSLDILLANLAHKNTSIKAVKCFATRLTSWLIKTLCYCCCCCPNVFEGQLKHHFVEIETDCGDFYTLEKTQEWYLFQECPEPPRHKPPAVRRFRDSEERVTNNGDPELVVEDEVPKEETVHKAIRYLDHFEFLEKHYHLGDDNCQDFARLMWGQLSSKPYPNAGQLGEEIPTMDELPFIEEDVVPTVTRRRGRGLGNRREQLVNRGWGRGRNTSSSGIETTPLLREQTPMDETPIRKQTPMDEISFPDSSSVFVSISDSSSVFGYGTSNL